MTENNQLRNFPFPPEPQDGDVVFHGDIVCQYYASSNTWACSRVTYKTDE